jgi:hypothetical protein
MGMTLTHQGSILKFQNPVEVRPRTIRFCENI